MSDSIHSRIVRVAQIAQRNARSSEEQTIAAELLDELKTAEVSAHSHDSIVVGPVPSVKVEVVAGGPLSPDSKFVPGQDVVVSAGHVPSAHDKHAKKHVK